MTACILGTEAWRGYESAMSLSRRWGEPVRLYLGGGNARLLDSPCAPYVELVSNEAGILGDIALCQDAKGPDGARLSGRGGQRTEHPGSTRGSDRETP